MKVLTKDLIGPALDWTVAKADENLYPKGDVRLLDGKVVTIEAGDYERSDRWQRYSPSTVWAQAGPLLNQHKISRTIDHSGLWIAYAGYNLNDEQRHMQCDRSELVAGLRCLVALNLGEVVDVPEELL